MMMEWSDLSGFSFIQAINTKGVAMRTGIRVIVHVDDEGNVFIRTNDASGALDIDVLREHDDDFL